jgi:hypothetical protein
MGDFWGGRNEWEGFSVDIFYGGNEGEVGLWDFLGVVLFLGFFGGIL